MDRKPGNSSAKEISMEKSFVNHAGPIGSGGVSLARVPILPLAQAVQDNLNAAHRIRGSAREVRVRLFGHSPATACGVGGVEVPVQPSISENVSETRDVLTEIESVLADILDR
jgi:hypothetical protein